jgi:hypothetical protein
VRGRIETGVEIGTAAKKTRSAESKQTEAKTIRRRAANAESSSCACRRATSVARSKRLRAPVTDAELVDALTKAGLPTKAAGGAHTIYHFYKHRTLLKQGWCEEVL